MKLFVHDLHGVLETGTEKGVRLITNEALSKLGYERRMTEEENLFLFGRKWFEYFAYLLPQENHERHMELQGECFRDSERKRKQIASVLEQTPHAYELLEAIAQSENSQIMISNTRPEGLVFYLTTLGYLRFFPHGFYFGADGHNNHSITKASILERFLKKNPFDDIIIIGDSPKDMELKNVAGGIAYHFTHPHLPRRECFADHYIDDLRAILKEL